MKRQATLEALQMAGLTDGKILTDPQPAEAIYLAGQQLAKTEEISYPVAHVRIIRMLEAIKAGTDPLKDRRGGAMKGAGRKKSTPK